MNTFESIELRDVGVTIGRTRVLQGITTELPGRGLVALAGPSGSGKTTLLGVLGGAIRCSGSVSVNDGTRRRSPNPVEAAWVFQVPRASGGHRAWEVAASPLMLSALPRELANGRAREQLQMLDLGEVEDRPFRRLSGGERQRVLLARAALEDKPLVLCDEPTAALDRAAAEVALELMRRVSSDRLVVIATHDQALWEACDEVVHLVDGTLRSAA